MLYATRDQLTGLWNRDYFFEMVEKTIRDNPKEEFVMIASDIFQFKMFNEILGTNTGDDLLLAIAQLYRERCKRLWVFSRISGDRYGLFMPKADFNEAAFMSSVRAVFTRKHYELKVHCYVGIYEVRDRHISAESMYNRAYMALESIKGDLHKDIAYYHEEILNKRIFETTTLDELDRALLNNEFEIYLQPQIEIEQNRLVSAEALIRWNKPGRGIVPPGEFIPIFASTAGRPQTGHVPSFARYNVHPT
jgi:diguanylate cyclase (GGDEF)-like protein